MKNTHNQIDQMVPLVVALVSIGIVLVVAFRIYSTAKEQEVSQNSAASCGLNATGGTSGTISYTNCGAGYNAMTDVEGATQDIVDWLPIVVIAVIGFLVLGIIAFASGR